LSCSGNSIVGSRRATTSALVSWTASVAFCHSHVCGRRTRRVCGERQRSTVWLWFVGVCIESNVWCCCRMRACMCGIVPVARWSDRWKDTAAWWTPCRGTNTCPACWRLPATTAQWYVSPHSSHHSYALTLFPLVYRSVCGCRATDKRSSCRRWSRPRRRRRPPPSHPRPLRRSACLVVCLRVIVVARPTPPIVVELVLQF